MNTFDLQVHSTASDGRHSPTDVVKMAKEKGVWTIALTDHDAVDGLDEAFSAGQEFGVRVIPGIEISVEENGAHILGYGIDFHNQALLDYSEEFKKRRAGAAQKMIGNLQKSGFTVDWQDVLNEVTGSVVARPHLARAVLKRPENKEKLGGVSTVHEFIEKFLSDESPNYVRSSHISAAKAIEAIKQAGGLAVWSHPAINFESRHDELEKFLKELMGWGLKGVEVFTSAHTEDSVELVYNLASVNKLLVTAGSDFHEAGDHKKSARGLCSASFVGDYPTYGFPTEGIVAKLEEAIKNVQK
ncbi:MAG: PHP domain-containing protein [bacterium]|nr:PHP domain-containing protein [bacterium]